MCVWHSWYFYQKNCSGKYLKLLILSSGLEGFGNVFPSYLFYVIQSCDAALSSLILCVPIFSQDTTDTNNDTFYSVILISNI